MRMGGKRTVPIAGSLVQVSTRELTNGMSFRAAQLRAVRRHCAPVGAPQGSPESGAKGSGANRDPACRNHNCAERPRDPLGRHHDPLGADHESVEPSLLATGRKWVSSRQAEFDHTRITPQHRPV